VDTPLSLVSSVTAVGRSQNAERTAGTPLRGSDADTISQSVV
jgi:hypothetical protein